ncbi:hypothetical protein KC19_10G124600 [Ceratodon purpureus]|uniref:AAA+ ATPase domain-containing protein n=1 Tax=Ceratodon purpureus TaxID=3225 RepID=A0A8T0GRW5_CERPU|nr:hypothetical protein KC19_10G124600 [Ceratodon purpureus]
MSSAMDSGLAATWIITIACAILASVGVGLFVAVGAYKIGKLAGKLKKVEEKAGVVAPVGSTDVTTPAPSAVKEGGATSDPKKEESDGSDDEDSDSDEEKESGSEEEEEEEKKKPRKGVKGAKGASGSGEKKGKKKTKEVKKKVKDDDWEWPVYDTWWSDVTYRMERKLRAKEKKGKPNSAPFEVTYEQRKGWPDEVTIKLRSKPLIQVAKKCLSKHSEALIIDEPHIDGQVMFHALNSFREIYQSMPEDNTALGRHHLKHLIRFLETEYKDTIVHVERMRRERNVTWALMWAFLPKDQEVYYKCDMTGQTLKGIVSFHYYYENMQGKHLRVFLKARNYNGRKYINCVVKVTIDEFRNEKSFEGIGICPFNILEESEVSQLEDVFLHNGRKFYNIVSQGSYYMQYEGPRLRMVLVNTCWQLKKQKADGRVMVDLLSFARMNPGYPLENAEPAKSCSPGGLTCGDQEMPSDEDLRLAPAIVYGFSFSNKQWGGFDVNGFSEIQFDDQAFDRDLVLSDPSRKQMLLALVSEYLRSPGDGDEVVQKLDPISNKGDGCIFLCYGPPGTGKTLTAESMAEKLHRPLWSISVFELGTNAKELETNLIEILDIASQWRAVLLLDEADIYMEKRTSQGDPKRTAMTAIFLRLLEYYRGVLFLTTNRVASFDDAFCSRISMFLRYHRLAGAQREAVWSNLFAKAGIPEPDLGPFLETQLNGREIRNTIRIAQTWAKSSGESLTTGHVLEVVNMLGEFRQDLEGAIRDESDTRSISRALAKVRSLKASGNGSDSDLNGNFVKVASTNDNDDDAI